MRSSLVSSLFALPLLAQSDLLDRAATLPPELYADVVLRLAEAGKLKVKDPDQLLERIFLLASQVKFDVQPDNNEDVGTYSDSLPGVIAASGLFKLDRLSIQVRAAVALKSAKLFREINPAPPPQTCDDPFSYRPDIYYQNLPRFPALAADAFRRITTSSQVGPALSVISQLPHPDELAIFLAGALPEIRDNWRAFSPTPFSIAKELPAHRNLLPAWRAWFTAHGNGRRCSPSRQISLHKTAIEFFNKLSDTPIDPKELKPSEVDKTPPMPIFWVSEKGKRIMAQYKELRFGGTEQILPETERSKPEWEARLRAFLTELSEWKHDDDETPRSIFHQRAIIHQALFVIIPPGPLHRKVTTEYVTFLALSPMRTGHPTEWLTYVHRLLRESKVAPEEIRRAGDHTLNVLLDVEQLAPRWR
jgi:hypothetical protein